MTKNITKLNDIKNKYKHIIKTLRASNRKMQKEIEELTVKLNNLHEITDNYQKNQDKIYALVEAISERHKEEQKFTDNHIKEVSQCHTAHIKELEQQVVNPLQQNLLKIGTILEEISTEYPEIKEAISVKLQHNFPEGQSIDIPKIIH